MCKTVLKQINMEINMSMYMDIFGEIILYLDDWRL